MSLITPTGTFTLDIAGGSNDTFEVLQATTGTNLEITSTAAMLPTGFDWQSMTPTTDHPAPFPSAFIMSAHFGSVPVAVPGGDALMMPVMVGDRTSP